MLTYNLEILKEIATKGEEGYKSIMTIPLNRLFIKQDVLFSLFVDLEDIHILKPINSYDKPLLLESNDTVVVSSIHLAKGFELTTVSEYLLNEFPNPHILRYDDSKYYYAGKATEGVNRFIISRNLAYYIVTKIVESCLDYPAKYTIEDPNILKGIKSNDGEISIGDLIKAGVLNMDLVSMIEEKISENPRYIYRIEEPNGCFVTIEKREHISEIVLAYMLSKEDT